MTLLGTIIVAAALLIGLGNGLRRGVLKEAIALIGILLGMVLVTLWADDGGQAIAQRTNWTSGTSKWIMSLILLWGTALLAGYGSGALIPQRITRLTPLLRVGGGLIGLVNWFFLCGFSLVLTQSLYYFENSETHKATWIRASPVSQFLLDRFNWIVLGIALVLAIAAFLVMLVRLVRGLRSSPRPSPGNAPSIPVRTNTASPGAASTQSTVQTTREQAVKPMPAPGMERSFLDKPQNPTNKS